MIKTAFFISSVADTDLAKATIAQLIKKDNAGQIFIIPLAPAALKRVEDLVGAKHITLLSLADIISQPNALTLKKLTTHDLQRVAECLAMHNIQRVYIGVASPVDEEIPYQIASHLDIPCVIAYEFMFKPTAHCFWQYAGALTAKPNCHFAVPLKSAEHDFLQFNPKAQVTSVGHLCIDRSQIPNLFDKSKTLQTIKIAAEDNLVFISGTTQPLAYDNDFLHALLSEISTGNYPTIQIRFGLHPGVKDPDEYLQSLLTTANAYPKAKTQFRIILTEQMKAKIVSANLKTHEVILQCDVSGADMAQAAERVGQAVPGALLNESALAGKPSFFHNKSVTPYLPEVCFSRSIVQFFTEKIAPPRSLNDLELQESAPANIAHLLLPVSKTLQ